MNKWNNSCLCCFEAFIQQVYLEIPLADTDLFVYTSSSLQCLPPVLSFRLSSTFNMLPPLCSSYLEIKHVLSRQSNPGDTLHTNGEKQECLLCPAWDQRARGLTVTQSFYCPCFSKSCYDSRQGFLIAGGHECLWVLVLYWMVVDTF